MRCVATAWRAHEAELRRFLRSRHGDAAGADDLLQEVFVRALGQGEGFCAVANPRAWLFQVARNLLVDRLRLAKSQVPLPDDLADLPDLVPAVDGLSACIPRALAELSAEDREAISLCDLEGLTQQAYAERLGLTLPAAKSRVQRARTRLRARLVEACQVRFDDAGQVCCFTPRPPVQGR
ncbi:RNA polymerase sigma factor SigZ [Aromatoleum bremense]|uniref:RNA polymerase sigma factor n=1 Tax=Aromatoleum bremense TaxID=76115 RepID=A0ABX1NXU0_9RHOO|nr:RNA polymerase sigma factor SigZ [Aromatoleum bremense]NMG16860.1 RNA polymerase sigma factor SigZ [Aromatoleum bremense]QTQ33264.1 Sigma-70 factor, ECF subfamily [Aromatoleum bremense]